MKKIKKTQSYTVKTFTFVGFYCRYFPILDTVVDLNFRQIFAIFKSTFVCFDYSPGLNFCLFESLAKMAKIKATRKNPFLQYLKGLYSHHAFVYLVVFTH